MSTRIVKAKESFFVGDRRVAQGETFDADHPIPQANPHFFVSWAVDNPVEQATKKPGEKRASKTAKKDE